MWLALAEAVVAGVPASEEAVPVSVGSQLHIRLRCQRPYFCCIRWRLGWLACE